MKAKKVKGRLCTYRSHEVNKLLIPHSIAVCVVQSKSRCKSRDLLASTQCGAKAAVSDHGADASDVLLAHTYAVARGSRDLDDADHRSWLASFFGALCTSN